VAETTYGAGSGWLTLDVSAAVQRWVRSPGQNDGLLLRVEGEASPVLRLASSQAEQEEHRPKLVLRYAIVGLPYDELRLGLLPGLAVAVVVLIVLYIASHRCDEQAADRVV
ncbi:MAG: DNRLRE domain-containing protein, partial [Chloroflexi bacterium]|nr:DNRLRE domain-containing protein [Chloroflexota bacterium]